MVLLKPEVIGTFVIDFETLKGPDSGSGACCKKSSVSIAGPFWRIIRLALHETDNSQRNGLFCDPFRNGLFVYNRPQSCAKKSASNL